MVEGAEKLKQVKEMVAKGLEIDMLKIEPPITPAVLFGTTPEDREKKVRLITAEIEK